MNHKVGPNDGLFHVRYYKCPRILRFKPTSTTRLLLPWVLIVVLLAATRGRQSASEILLAQDFGKTLTAAPVSIKYLHLWFLSATYNNLWNNMGKVASAESCRVWVIPPDARVATLLWLSSLKKMRRGSCTCVPCHRNSCENSRQVH